MVNILYSPRWFFGKDIFIDVISIIVLVMIAYVTYQYYRIDRRKKKHFLFSLSMIILAVSFLFKILTNFTLYQFVLRSKTVGLMTIFYKAVQFSDTLFITGTLLYRFLTLLGLFLLFSTYYKKQHKIHYFLITYFIIILTYYTFPLYHLFYLTSFVFVLFVILRIYKNVIKTNDNLAKLIMASFILIAISQIVFIFMYINNSYYVVAELIQLLGYILLLISFTMVCRYGKKK